MVFWRGITFSTLVKYEAKGYARIVCQWQTAQSVIAGLHVWDAKNSPTVAIAIYLFVRDALSTRLATVVR